MKLFSKDEIAQKRKAQNRELTIKNDKTISSLKKIIKLQNDIDVDQEKAKKFKEYEVWCEDLNNKKSIQLQELKKYTTATELAKEELFAVIARKDMFEDAITELQEEIGRLELQVNFKKELLSKQLQIC